MAIYTDETLEQAVREGKAGTCISIDGARVIIPTACSEVVGFTNPDDLDPNLKDRWKSGERGPEFENQKLKPGDCLVMYNNGRDMNKLLEENPDWYKTADGIKSMIENLYNYVDVGANLKEPAIWNSDLNWAKEVHFITSANEEVDEKLWQERCGRAIEGLKRPKEQLFVHLLPGDKLRTPVLDAEGKQVVKEDGRSEYREQTAGGMSAIAVKQPDNTWNIVQLGAKGYIVVKEKVNSQSYSKTKDSVDWLQKKKDALAEKLGDKVGKTVKQKDESVKDFDKRIKKQIDISMAIMKQKRQK
ncbi:MAG: hypothetical protein IJ532_08395 [Alphaproteobacteria bacterium]|nr:hypothetical protein [Alphaproteobacteria bacterium]